MTIHTNRQTRLIKFECDWCSDILDAETTALADAIAALDEAGWDQRKKDGAWQHICEHPTCEYP